MLRPVVLLCAIFLISNLITSIKCKSSYTVIAPGTIRSNRKYSVSATLHNVSHPATLVVGLRHNSSWSEQQQVSLQPLESKLIEFFPPKLDLHKKYELFVEGVEGLYFYNSTKLLVGQHEGINIYIETDRGIYKPGDLLRFRIVILDEHAKPVKITEPIKVQIFDGEGNRVKLYKDISFDQGVHTNTFQLSKEPILGSWFIKVFVSGRYAQERTAEFKVDKYILPKFFVKIETQSTVLYDEGVLKIIVYGKYVYNKPVEGKVDLRIRQSEMGFTFDLENYAADTVDAKATFEIDLNDFSDRIMSNRLIVSASLKEKQTGATETATTDIYLQHQSHNITLLDDEIEFKNGRISLVKILIQHWNKTVVNDPETSVHLQVVNRTFEIKLDKNGIVVLKGEFNAFEKLTVNFKNTEVWFFLPGLSGIQTLNSNCVLMIKNKSPKLNSPIDINVVFQRNIPYLIYTLTAHGNIIENKFVHVNGTLKTQTIRLFARYQMVPVSFLYVHFVYAGYLTSCEMKIQLPEKFENELSVSTPTNVKPGQNITMTVNTQPGSRLAITAVDLSSMLLNKGNKIQKGEIIRNMREDTSHVVGYLMHPGLYSGLVTLSDIPYIVPNSIRQQSIPSDLPAIEKDIRSYFPETWIFSDLNVTDAVTAINFTLPDSITTWIFTAFSVNDKTGIGFIDAEIEILAFKTFFISAYLPYSIKRGEVVSIPVVVSNYHSECLITEVVMENPFNEFQFVDMMTNKTRNCRGVKRNIVVPPNSGKSVNFLIKAHKLGQIDIRLQAKNKLASDKVLYKLLVEADGLPTSHNHELYINLQKGQTYKTRYKPNFPPQVESNTEFLQLSISGDILLPSLDNIDNLVDMPTGCGEQNMINLVPNILVLEYISVTGQSSKYADLVAKAKRYTEIGFQQQLRFRHSNGGYSVFGPEHSETPSNWLTAYVARFFIRGMKYFSIETRIIESSLKYLADTQLSTGEFPSAGYLFQQGYRSSNSFTAFVLLSFLENAKYAKKYKTEIRKALNFLSNNVNKVDDIYSLAIMAVVFQTAKHEKASIILDKLKPLAKTKDDLQWWYDPLDNGYTDVEITSYVLLALLHTPGHYLPITKWLIDQRSSHGGFKSTQSTVVGLQALIKFAQLSAAQNDTAIKVFYKSLSEENVELETGILGLDSENLKVLQHCQLPPSTRTLDLEVSGTGSVFLQFSYNYRKQLEELKTSSRTEEKTKTFVVQNTAELTENGLTMNLEICIGYKPEDNTKDLKTNMVIAEVGLPSGYIAREGNIEDLRGNEAVERLENEIPDKIVFYFTYTEANEEKCIDLVADKKHEVRNLKPSKIIVYEYYHPDRREVVAYKIENHVSV